MYVSGIAGIYSCPGRPGRNILSSGKHLRRDHIGNIRGCGGPKKEPGVFLRRGNDFGAGHGPSEFLYRSMRFYWVQCLVRTTCPPVLTTLLPMNPWRKNGRISYTHLPCEEYGIRTWITGHLPFSSFPSYPGSLISLIMPCGVGFVFFSGFAFTNPQHCAIIPFVRGISAAGSAPQWHCGGHRFDSDMLHSFDLVF